MSPSQTSIPEPNPGNPTGERSPFPPALMEHVGFLLQMVRGGTLTICMNALAPLKLHVRQFGLLTVLATEGPRSQQDLAEWIRMDRTTMVALIDGLEERGYVRRERNPDDRRAYLLQLTPEGKRTQRRAEELMQEAENEILASLTKRERRELLDLLGKVGADIGRVLP
jgi:DNA-binding MarR family transcriptional regulator